MVDGVEKVASGENAEVQAKWPPAPPSVLSRRVAPASQFSRDVAETFNSWLV
jgi:hypothetical protein